jgi:hypothetical protein
MKILSYISRAFKWLFSDLRRLVICVMFIALGLLYFNYKSLKNSYDNLIIAHNDTLCVYKNKVGELYAQKTAYMTDLANLKLTNKELYDEVKNLKENPLVVTKTEFIIKRDSLEAETDTTNVNVDIANNDTIYKSNFSYKDDWTSILGHSDFNTSLKYSNVFFDNIAFKADLTMDLIEKNNNLLMIAKSSNPYLQINNMDGYMLSPEKSKMLKKRFNKPWGVMVGVGPSVTIIDNKVQIVPSLQLTVGYKFISF